MNKILSKVNEETVLFMDIECVRRSKELDINSREFDLFQKKTRDRATDEYLTSEEVLEKYKKRAALKMCYNKIISVSVGFIHNKEAHIKCLWGEEEDIIKQFCEIASRFEYMCFSNGIAFDLPMLINNGYRYFNVSEVLPDRFMTSGKKQWNLDRLLDLQEIFRGTHYEPNSLDEICYHFNLPSPKTDLEGSMVSDEYWENGIEKIVEYNKQDVFACMNLFKKMRFQPIFQDFIDKNKVKSNVVHNEKNILQKIVNEEPVQNIEVKKLIKKAEDARQAGKPIVDLVNRYS